MSVFETAAPAELESPFRGGATFAVSEAPERPAPPPVASAMESPFVAGVQPLAAGEAEATAFRELLRELEDEHFEEAIAQLIDEAAGVHLASQSSWSSPEAGAGMAMNELEAWIEPLRAESRRMLDNMADRLEGEELETLRDPELDMLFESLRPDAGVFPEAFENFLGHLFRGATTLVKHAVKLGRTVVSTVGSVVSAPIRLILGKLADLAKALLRGVVQKLAGQVPAPMQPIVRTLAARLLGEAEAEALAGSDQDLARSFDMSAAGLLFAGSEAEAEGIVAELEAALEEPRSAAASELDDARARLAQELGALPAGSEPLAELEQFLPALLAARPAIKMGIGLIGRDKVVNFLAEKIAGLIKGIVGIDDARIVSPALVNVGLSALGLEAPEATGSLAGEALASTVEETVDHVLTLPAEAFEDTLRLEAEIQSAFAAAAAHHIPAEFLRHDLPEIETAGEGGVWVLMPRTAWPQYRYKKYSHVFTVPITRQAARAVPTADGGTAETMLLDRGVTSWPVPAEIHLYETLPETTHLGHIAQFENEGDTPISEALADVQPLTPEAAAALLHEPALGRPLDPPHHVHHAYHPHRAHPEPSHAAPAHMHGDLHDHRWDAQVRDQRWHAGHGPAHIDPTATHPATSAARLARPLPGGQRYFRIRLPGQVRAASARPQHRIGVRFRGQPTPTLDVHVRLSEREAQELAAMLQHDQSPTAVAWLKDRYQRVLPTVLTAHILRHHPVLGRHVHAPGTPHHHAHHGHVVRFALGVTEAVTQAMSAFVRDRRAELMTTVQSAAQGITFTFVFDLAAPGTPSGSGAAQPAPPHVQVQPGFHAGHLRPAEGVRAHHHHHHQHHPHAPGFSPH